MKYIMAVRQDEMKTNDDCVWSIFTLVLEIYISVFFMFVSGKSHHPSSTKKKKTPHKPVSRWFLHLVVKHNNNS